MAVNSEWVNIILVAQIALFVVMGLARREGVKRLCLLGAGLAGVVVCLMSMQ